jgi:hypothetical protein
MENLMANLYESTEELHDGFVVIRIKSGPFEGVEYTYGKIGITETDDKKYAKLILNTTVVKNPKNVILEDEFHKVAGDIVLHLLDEWLKEKEENESENRIDDITEPDDERRLLSQGDPISEE